MVPAAGQGIVGVTVREDDTELRELLAAIEDPEAKAVVHRRTRAAGAARRLLPHADRRLRAAAAERRAASDRAGRARRWLVPAEAQPARRGRATPSASAANSAPACAPTAHTTSLPDAAAGVLITRPEPGASETAARVAALGYRPVVAPLLEIRTAARDLPPSGHVSGDPGHQRQRHPGPAGEPSPPAAVRRRRGHRRARTCGRIHPRQQRRRRLPRALAALVARSCDRERRPAAAGLRPRPGAGAGRRSAGARLRRRAAGGLCRSSAARPAGRGARRIRAPAALTAALFFSAETARQCVRLLRGRTTA